MSNHTKCPRKSSQRGGSLRALLANIVESSQDAIYSRRLDGTVSSWNAAAERIFGYRADEIIGQSSAVLLPPDRADETAQLLERIRRGQRIEHFETIRLHKKGKPLTVSLCVSPILNARGQVVGASTIARDITTERQLEAELLKMSEQERQRLGHDLHDGVGQQLSGIELVCRSLANALAQHGLPEAKTATLLVTQVQQALEQIRALARGFSPVMDRANGLMLALEEFTHNTGSLLRIKCTFHCEEPVLIAEHRTAIHLFRIAQEAVNNALRHGKARHVDISLSREAKRITLKIQDNGLGLPAKLGTAAGMGLRIMRYRASSIGSILQIRKALPKGTLVSCMVPSG